uniref:NAD(P)-binding domain-containing protein n=1 Tax=Lysinibacillus sp. D4A1_S13 TaxID=2941228 RepID=UPI0020C13E19
VRAKKIPNQNICVINRRNTERIAELEHQYGIQGIAFDSMKTEDIDVFILAMKLKDAEIALATLKRRIQPHQI